MALRWSCGMFQKPSALDWVSSFFSSASLPGTSKILRERGLAGLDVF
jgi:hypothetical protein